ncbi:MAG: PQQ-binding-like beta-propeller repeat protein [Bacteroidota bacterium]|nr:PQQ-binding-like beta-propeller repeat protein [Bacteroidota bacterium]
MKNIYSFSLILIIALLASCSQVDISISDDWRQYKSDNYRSGVSSTSISIETLGEVWEYSASQMPVRAWYGPAYEDAFANSGPLPSMRDYDLAYYPIIVGDRLYYGSTSDDAIHCLDNNTGEELWHYTTNGPIHISPVYDSGNLYFGSDDGYVYSLKARNGKLNWKFSPSDQSQTKVLNNGRLISFWPIRTGTLIEDGIVYFGASLLPWKSSYFCAIDQKTGKLTHDNCYVRKVENRTFEGSMASTGTALIQPQGRIAPAFFDKTSGEPHGSLPGTGGCFVLVTKDDHIIHPHTSRKKSLHELSNVEEPDFMTFDGGKEIVVKGDTSFVLTDNALSAYERSSKKLIWLRRNFKAHKIILAGDFLFAGSTDKVFGISTRNGLPIWEIQVEGTVFALAAAQQSIYASTNEGKIYRFSAGRGENKLFALNYNSLPEIEEKTEKLVIERENNAAFLLAGPFIKAISENKILVTFQTHDNIDCSLHWLLDNEEIDSRKSISKKEHSFTLDVRKDFRYLGLIKTADEQSFHFEYDNFFNFKKPKMSFSESKDLSSEEEGMIATLLNSEKTGHGTCFIIGSTESAIPLSILKQSDHHIIQLAHNLGKINKLRERLSINHIYGTEWSAYTLSDIPLNQIMSNLASSIWLESADKFHPDQIIQLLAPEGKAIIRVRDGVSKWLDKATLAWQIEHEEFSEFLVITKNQIENQGEWTHQYAKPDNSAFGGESLWGSTSTEEFDVQWMGRPGPRFQTDRSGRKPSPLSISGKLFIEGKERVLAQDVYNGAIYWTKHFPGFIRMNIHRDCSNWAADEAHLYMGIGNNILKVNQDNGDVDEVFQVNNDEAYESGFVSVLGDFIVGSTSPAGSHYTDYHGGAGWYDWAEGPMAEKVISKSIFKKSKKTGTDIWRYKSRGVILNATITHLNNTIYFVESRTPELMLSEKKRAKDDVFNSILLIALDLDSGETAFEKKLSHHPGKTAYSMAAGSNKLVILSSGDQNYHLYTHSADDGNLIWKDESPWFHGNHGGHLSRPAIVGNKLIVKPSIYDLTTGIPLDYNVPKSGHGCASYALTEQSIFYRGGSVTQFNFDTREFSRWERLRPDCWISTIPAQGMILSPEAGGGCSCGNWLETSMVLAPFSRAPITIERAGDEHFIDFKDETYGQYHQQYLPNEFIDNLEVKITLKPGTNASIYYTIDGSEPTENSSQYSSPISVAGTAQVKTLTVVKTEKGDRRYFRNKTFTKVDPEAE